MSRPSHTCSFAAGHSLIELVLVLSLLAACAAAGSWGLLGALESTEARVSAQAWQAAATAAQSRALWTGSPGLVAAGPTGLRLTADGGQDPAHTRADLGPLATYPVVNVGRWRVDGGSVVTFSAGSAAPDSGGALFFGATAKAIRVVVRVESGLTVRSAP